jgi:hypothetical protein
MKLADFAERHRLRVRRAEDGEPHVPGRDGQLYEHDDARLAVVYLDGTPRAWGHRKRACLAAGMTLLQDGDAEGTLLFDPANPEHVRLAVEVVGARRRKQLSEEHRQKLVAAGAAHRFASDDDGCSDALHALETTSAALAG